jgi:hypothetical protein
MKKSGEQFYMRTGQIPTPSTLAAMRASRGQDPTLTFTQPLPDVTPRLSITSITRNVGLDPSAEYVWQQFLRSVVDSSSDEVQFRQRLYDRARELKTEPALAKAIVQRATQFWRGQQIIREERAMRRSMSKSTGAYDNCRDALMNQLTSSGEGGIPFDGLDFYLNSYGADILSQVLENLILDKILIFDGIRFYMQCQPPAEKFVAWV